MTAAPEEAVPVAAGTTTAAEGTVQGAVTRWVAEAVSLSPAEAGLSLEAEMFRTLAPSSGATPPPAVAEETAAVSLPGAVPATPTEAFRRDAACCVSGGEDAASGVSAA